MSAKVLSTALALLAGCATAPQPAPLADASAEQRAWAAACADFDEWDKPGPPFRIYGETYYVGTCGIAAILVADARGHTLIDSGTDKGAEIVLANIRALGFDPKAVDTILMSHEHFDHVGGLAKLQTATGATILATAPAAAVLRSGTTAPDDPQAGENHPPFAPVKGRLGVIEGGSTQGRFESIATPGHTLGALSWRWRVCEGTDCKWLVYADSMNPISDDEYRFSANPALVAAFRQGIADLAASPCDILLTPHPGSSGLRKRLAGDIRLADPEGCRAYADGVAERLDRRLADEAGKGG
jgi:metallo-beta-lactamase class B